MALTTPVDMADSFDSELQVVTIAAGYPSYDVHILQVVVQLRLQAGLIVMATGRSVV